MNSRQAQDVILRLLADGPYRAGAMNSPGALEPEAVAVLAKIDLAALDRFGRFLCRHYFRERIVHYFKYSRALAPLTQRPPEAALKSPEFNALMPSLVLGDRASAEAVLALIKRHLTRNAETIRSAVPYWDDLLAYQGAFFLSDALPAPHEPRRFAARAETAIIIELAWDLPAVLPALLGPFGQLPLPTRKPIRLLFARSPHGEVTALRCGDALKDLLEGLTGEVDPSQVAARMGLGPGAFHKAMRQLEQLGAVVAQETFSASHVGSDLPQTR
jgi:hypothetical protein